MLDKMQKVCVILMAVLLLGVCAVRYGPYIPLPDWGGIVVPTGPVTMVVVIEESGERTAEQAAVILGPLSKKLRAANKWRLWDKDKLPQTWKAQVDGWTAKQPPPYYVLFRDKTIAAGPRPLTTEAELQTTLDKNGGY